MTRPLTTEEFKERIKGRGFQFISPQYANGRDKHLFRCDKCSHEWEARPQAILRANGKPIGTGCPRCAGKAFTQDELTQRLLDRGLEPLETVVKSNAVIRCKCMVCDSETKSSPTVSKDVKGYGCESCCQPKSENHYRYDPNISDETRGEWDKKHMTAKVRAWSKKVKELADFTCDCCKVRGGVVLHSHHLNSWIDNKEQRYDLDNGVCLCVECHYDFHRKFGQGYNTKQQYLEFKEVYNASIAK